MDSLSDDVLQEIFLRMSDPKLIATCALICRRSAAILAPASLFWVTKCKRDKRSIPAPLLGETADRYVDRLDYRLIWRHNPYGRNLIKKGENQWQVTGSFRMYQMTSRGTVTCPPNYASDGAIFWYVPAFGDGKKLQTVDLWSEGIAPWILDELKPTIVASEWYDCGSFYALSVSLMGTDGEMICQPFKYQRIGSNNDGGNWTKAMHKFKNYPPGVRFVLFVSGGKYRRNEGDSFGAKMTRPSVTVEFE